jgi:hypothetical protein
VERDGAEDCGAWLGRVDGWGDELGCVEGLVEGLSALWPGAVTRGFAWLDWPCHESATDPPSGTSSDVTPVDEYFHVPDLPSDHHSDQ